MRVEAVGHSASQTARVPLSVNLASSRPQKSDTRLTSAEPELQSSPITPVEPPVIAPVEAVPTLPEAPQNPDPAEEGRGVLRLLESGHFQGVADVRLRINFFEELSARAADRGAAVLADGSRDLISAVEGKAEEVLAPLADETSQEEITALLAEFRTAVDAATVDPAVATDDEALAAALQSAFDGLVAGLREQLAGPAVEAPPVVEGPPAAELNLAIAPLDAPVPPEIETPPVAPEESPSTPLDDALAVLTDFFATALTQLIESLDAELQLPPPSPANGNGQAYDKFLAEYNDLLSDGAVNALA